MTTALALFLAIALIVFAWAGARLIRAMRLGRRGFDIDAEDRRLRGDPRFTDIWVQEYRPEPPPDEKKEPPPAG